MTRSRLAGEMGIAAKFTLTYDGRALADGRMEVAQVAPAMTATAELMHLAHKLQFPGEPRIRLEVSPPRRGSLELPFAIWQASDAQQLLLSPPALALGSTITLWTGGKAVVRSVQRAWTWLTRPADQIDARLDDEARLLVRDPRLLRQMQAIAKPLEREGVEIVTLTHEAESSSLTKEDLPALEIPEKGPMIDQQTIRATVTVHQLVFKPGAKWQVRFGDATKWCAIEDEHFDRAVCAGEIRIGPNDRLDAMLRISVYEGVATNTPVAEWAIEEVLEVVLPAPDPQLGDGESAP